MSVNLICYILGGVSIAIGVAFLPALAVAMKLADGTAPVYGLPALAAFALGAGLMYKGREHKLRLLVRDCAVVLMGVWGLLSLFGMLPFLFAGGLPIEESLYESVSAVTTTGLSELPADASLALVFWRSILQWLGGLAIVLLLVTVIPQVSNSFGMSLVMPKTISFVQLIKPMWRLARGVAAVYAVATLLSFFAYRACGLRWFDAINLGLVTLATGGCYTVGDIAEFRSLWLDFVMMFFMFFASGNFLIYREAARHQSLKEALADREMQAMLVLAAVFGTVISLYLWAQGTYPLAESLRHGFFQTMSFISTTGFASAQLVVWPDFVKYMLFILVFVGGCIGSSTGGFKIIRFLVLFKEALAETRRTLHPHMMVHISIGGRTVPQHVVSYILTIFFLYIAAFFVATVLVSLSGMEPLASMGVAAACVSSAGPAAFLAGHASAYASLAPWVKLLCCALMILGRLEIFAFLIVVETLFSNKRERW